jgi:hypothetical protein
VALDITEVIGEVARSGFSFARPFVSDQAQARALIRLVMTPASQCALWQSRPAA